MEGINRRSFIRRMGQSALVLGMGISQGDAFAGEGQSGTGAKKTRRIAVEEHMGFKDGRYGQG